MGESELNVNQLKRIANEELEDLRQNVATFFCEDRHQFKLEECFQIFVLFVQHFQKALEENKVQEEKAQRTKARQSKNRGDHISKSNPNELLFCSVF